MRRLLVVFFSLLLVLGCEHEIKEDVVELYSNGNTKKIEKYYSKGSEKIIVGEVHYHTNGSKFIEGNLKNNEREGLWKSWYENGNLWSGGEYKHGDREGITKVYYENGQLQYEGKFTNNKRTDTWLFYDEKGVKIQEVSFANDTIQSVKEFNKGVPFK